MKLRICISRTFQAQQFEPIKMEVEIEKEVKPLDYDEEFASTYEDLEKSLTETEVKLKEIYCPEEETDRKPKRKRKRNL
jgi:hypothetical protein